MGNAFRVVVIDPEVATPRPLERELRSRDFEVVWFDQADQALDDLALHPAPVVFASRRLTVRGGRRLCEVLQHIHPAIEVFCIADSAAEAQSCAGHGVTRPLGASAVLGVIASERDPDMLESGIVGRSDAIRRAFAVVRRVGPAPSSVLILGESGTGKELFARAIHQHSPRRGGPFVAINCSAFPEGLLESELFGHVAGAFTGAAGDHPGLVVQAGSGTLFLDEVADMSPRLQSKLLRALQERAVRPVGGAVEVPVDVRVIAATHRDLDRLSQTPAFRRDLYWRLSVVPLRLPPLRDRLEDIPPLVDRVLARLGLEAGGVPHWLSPRALRALSRLPWRGNVRELENTLERAFVLARGRVIGPDDLAVEPPVWEHHELPTLCQLKRLYVNHVLERVQGDLVQTAEILGVSRRTMYRWRRD